MPTTAPVLWKGHGTGNDFVVLPDPDGAVDLTPELVRAWCDRHTGLGADGVLRVVRTAALPGATGAGEWFMDYRNADGSVSEMCGNGVRVFARYLAEAGLVDPGAPLPVSTRGGDKAVTFDADGQISVDMGAPEWSAEGVAVRAPLHDGQGALAFAGQAVRMPNPHVVCQVRTSAQLAALDLSAPPAVDPGLPGGQNVEFVVRDGEREITLRVHERGVGETLSCGTGICAAVAALTGPPPATPATRADGAAWTVHVPGGTCRVTPLASGALRLTGPAVLVARVEPTPSLLRG